VLQQLRSGAGRLADAGTDRLTDTQIDTLNGQLTGFPILQHDTASGRLTLRFQVDTESIRSAAEAAFDAACNALMRAYPVAPQLTGVRVISDAELAVEIGPPDDVIGYTEIGEILGVSRQRAQQIASKHAGFPRPVATPLAGTFYSRAAVLAFQAQWPRKRTGRPVGGGVPRSG
jgi:hypothetical protein